MLTETVTWVHHWSERVFSFRTTRSPEFRFIAGEFTTIGLEGAPMRAYSMANPPWANHLEFLSIKIPEGELTSKLQQIQPGEKICVRPKTTGTLRGDLLKPSPKLLLLATGTGLAPFLSIIQDVEILEMWNEIELWHSVHSRDDLVYHSELTNGVPSSEITDLIKPRLRYKPLVTGEGDPRITSVLNAEEGLENCSIMICGNLNFNRDCITILENKGLREGSFRMGPGNFVTERAFVDR